MPARSKVFTLNMVAITAALTISGCNEQQRDTNATASATVSIGAAPASSAEASASGAPIPASSAEPKPTGSAAADTARIAGTWEGHYLAKKGSVAMPGKLKDAARDADDGKAASGEGTITLTISADGEISGKAKGALGDATLRGKVVGDTVRASVFPNNPNEPPSMSGQLIGSVKEGAISAEIRVSGPDATVVRESVFELKKM